MKTCLHIEKFLRLPLDKKSIAGYVATTKEFVFVNKPYSDPRFNKDIDIRTG